MDETLENNPFDLETWNLLPGYFEKLPRKVQINIWGDPNASFAEDQAQKITTVLAARFDQIASAFFPRRVNYDYYPVIGIFDFAEEAPQDKGVRLIGLPTGYQMTSLIAAIQSVSFQGTTLEAATRIRLQKLDKEVQLEILTSAEDEAGALLAKSAFGLAVASPQIRAYLIMTDAFPMANVRYSVKELPHLVINGRHHIQGVVEEAELLKQIAAAIN